MASGALFGNASSRSKSKNLVEFKAGKMYLKGNMCHPDKRKGLLYVYQADDSLMHFCWKDRATGTVDDDLIIFPDDIEFKNVPQCKTGRVYVLKFKSSSRKYIFWMQESKDDKDEENCRKVNEALNNPPTPSASRAGGGLGGLPADLATLTGDNDLQSILGSMNQQQLLQLLGGMGGAGPSLTSALLRGSGGGRPVSSSQASSAEEATTPLSIRSSPGPQSRSATDGGEGMLPRPATVAAVPSHVTSSTPTTSSAATTAAVSSRAPGVNRAPNDRSHAPVQLSDLQNILASVNMAATTSAPASATSQDVHSSPLKTALSSNRMIRVLADSSVQQKLKEHMTSGSSLPSTEERLREAITAPIFQEITNAFHTALAARQLSSLLGSFGLPEAAIQAASQGDVEAFVKAMDDTASTDTKMDEN